MNPWLTPSRRAFHDRNLSLGAGAVSTTCPRTAGRMKHREKRVWDRDCHVAPLLAMTANSRGTESSERIKKLHMAGHYQVLEISIAMQASLHYSIIE